ncbi:MAG: succinylglutamate desuccinylase/aspartoacylase family protein [Planctomycetes bacterium]|nr:succinylglutamate desuccinylase/aspartoacylase family protein [Planctomycetota bacterium]
MEWRAGSVRFGDVAPRAGCVVRGALNVVRHPTGGVERVPIVVALGRRDGPTVWVTANIHGDEVTGVLVAHECVRRLLAPSRLRGMVVVVPSLNPAGLRVATRVPYYEERDPNRLFPDSRARRGPGAEPPGPQEEFFATVFDSIRATADVLLDLHCTWIQSLPHVIVDRVLVEGPRGHRAAERLLARTEALARAFGLTAVREWRVERYIGRDLQRSVAGAVLNRARIPAITVELGARLVADPAAVEAGVAGVENALRWAGSLPGEPVPIRCVPVVAPPYALLREEHPRCPESGIVRFCVRPGDRVERGMAVATLSDLWGRPLAGGEVRSTRAGWVLGLNQGVAFYRGAVLLQLAIRDKHPVVARDPRRGRRPMRRPIRPRGRL